MHDLTKEPRTLAPREEPISGTPDNPPWNGWVALGVFFASIVFILISASVFLTPYLKSTTQVGSTDLERFIVSDPTAVFLQLVSVVPAHFLTLALCWFVATKGGTYPVKQVLGWQMNGFRVWHAIGITATFYALFIVAVVLLGKVEHSFDQMLASSKWIVIPVVILAVLTAPIVEETVYRGIMYSAWQRVFGKYPAAAAVTILFTLVHGAQYSQSSKPDVATLSVLFLLSLTLTIVRIKTGNLLPAIVLHTVFNLFQSIIMLISTFIVDVDPTNPATPSGQAVAVISGLR